MPPSDRPELVTIQVWGLPATAVPWALGRMASERLRRTHPVGRRFARRLGTGHGRTFTLRDADLRHWALIASWETAGAAAAYERHRDALAWNRRADECWTLRLTPLSSTGRWSGAEPFGPTTTDQPADGRPVAILTRARIAPRQLRAFRRAVPRVARRLAEAPGLRFARGIGEAPVGLQATLSIWDDLASAHAFAYATAEHREAVRSTRAQGWFTEQLFARFGVIDSVGTVDGRDPLAARTSGTATGEQWGDRP